MSSEALDDLAAAAELMPESPSPDLNRGVEETFSAPGRLACVTADPFVKAVLSVLEAEYPRAFPVSDLLGKGAELMVAWGLGQLFDLQEAYVLRDQLVGMYMQGMIELRPKQRKSLGAPRLTVHALARLEAESLPFLTTAYHTSYPLDEVGHPLVRLLDGNRDMDQVIAAMVQLVTTGELPIEFSGKRLTEPATVEPLVRELVERELSSLHRWGLLAR